MEKEGPGMKRPAKVGVSCVQETTWLTADRRVSDPVSPSNALMFDRPANGLVTAAEQLELRMIRIKAGYPCKDV